MGRLAGVVFDKTGTLTQGSLRVTDVVAARGRSEAEVLALAAALEQRAGHPLGEAVLLRAREQALPQPEVGEPRLLPGRGVTGRVSGRQAFVGSHRLLDEHGLCDHRLDSELRRLESGGKTTLLLALEGEGLVGVVALADLPRPEAAEAVRELRAQGLAVAMLTGDNPLTAQAVAASLGIERWAAGLLPQDKVDRVRALQAELGPLAMVGDGVNDAPALAAAEVGVAMAVRGSDATLETADVALVSDDLRRLAETVRLGRAALRVIRGNVALSLAVKAVVLGLALAGLGSLWAAVAADMGASLLVVGNGLRLLQRGRR
jgi:Cd2+/Zn2+-exporting ATPase